MSEAKNEASELSGLLARVAQLEERVRQLETKPPQYVPPPTYGPMPAHESGEITLSEDETNKLCSFLKEHGDPIAR